jgi:hypothetical protein
MCKRTLFQNVCQRLHLLRLKTARTAAVCTTLAAGIALVSHAAFAHSVTIGSANVNDVSCNSTSWVTVLSINILSYNHAHSCAMTASAEVRKPAGYANGQSYDFTVSIDSANPPLDHPAARSVELNDYADTISEPDVWPVATTYWTIALANAPHAFRFQCRKAGPPFFLTLPSAMPR